MQVMSRQRGISLIEVMMSVLIFSIGLIGLAGLMVMATRSNHSAYLRTQVTFLANSMADRMSGNPTGIWSGAYNSSAYPVSSTSVGCASGAACTPADLALHDQRLWSDQLRTFLPNPKATVDCSGVTAVSYNPTAQLSLRPPYGGTCKMSVTWSERGAGNKNNSDSADQVFVWEFQP